MYCKCSNCFASGKFKWPFSDDRRNISRTLETCYVCDGRGETDLQSLLDALRVTHNSVSWETSWGARDEEYITSHTETLEIVNRVELESTLHVLLGATAYFSYHDSFTVVISLRTQDAETAERESYLGPYEGQRGIEQSMRRMQEVKVQRANQDGYIVYYWKTGNSGPADIVAAYRAGPSEFNVFRFENSGKALKWVQAHSEGWNHDDWLELLADLLREGYWPLNQQKLGELLERMKRWLRLMRMHALR
jgi:hypothetical protein